MCFILGKEICSLKSLTNLSQFSVLVHFHEVTVVFDCFHLTQPMQT